MFSGKKNASKGSFKKKEKEKLIEI